MSNQLQELLKSVVMELFLLRDIPVHILSISVISYINFVQSQRTTAYSHFLIKEGEL